MSSHIIFSTLLSTIKYRSNFVIALPTTSRCCREEESVVGASDTASHMPYGRAQLAEFIHFSKYHCREHYALLFFLSISQKWAHLQLSGKVFKWVPLWRKRCRVLLDVIISSKGNSVCSFHHSCHKLAGDPVTWAKGQPISFFLESVHTPGEWPEPRIQLSLRFTHLNHFLAPSWGWVLSCIWSYLDSWHLNRFYD